VRRILCWVAIALSVPAILHGQAAPTPTQSDGVSRVLRELERVLVANDTRGYAALMAPVANSSSPEIFNEWIEPGITRAVVQERLRVPSANVTQGQGVDVYVDVMSESGIQGRVGTWLLELRRDSPASDSWHISKLTVLTTIRGLYRLSLNATKQFTVTNLHLQAEDFELEIPEGAAFVAEIEDAVTGIVVLGRGEATFSPALPAERGQVKIYAGSETLRTKFSWLYVRMHPDDFATHVRMESLQPRQVNPRDLRRADAVFHDNMDLTFGLDLGDLSRERWSVIPKPGDLVAEFDTARAHLTYMRSGNDPEDIRFFDRTHQRTISIYPSKERLSSGGPFFSEDDQTDFDILNYEIDASFDPRREWIEGRATLLVTPRRSTLSSITLTLAEPLTIRSVTSRKLGYLMALRVKGHNDVIINLPSPIEPNQVIDIQVAYGGRLPATPPEREVLALQRGEPPPSDFFSVPVVPSYIYTGRSNWYPQGQVTDYATAQLTLRVPQDYTTVASGALDAGYPKILPSDSRDPRAVWREYRFSATQPVRYLGWATSHFVHVDGETVTLEQPEASLLAGVSYHFADLAIEASGMLQRRARELSPQTQDVLKFFGTLMGDIPYQSFTLAVVERNMPGGHSPPYFAALSQPPPATPIAWRTDPAYFDDFPEFFLAHEAAHQWWGQAVGWKNYHEQWLSEGFAQYFAALYAEQLKRRDVFDQVIRQMTRWTLDRSDQGPVYLGYRLGHIKNDSRTFRALVYNKGALSLHMLRLLLGDDVFFRGIRRFYTTWRFQKAGTEDLKHAFEAEAGRPLDRYFERWIYGSTLPQLKFSYTTGPDAVTARFEQVGEIFDVPVTVTVQYANNTSIDVVVPVTDRVSEVRIPTSALIRSVEANRDDKAPVIFVK
jgi:hypothetical protein